MWTLHGAPLTSRTWSVHAVVLTTCHALATSLLRLMARVVLNRACRTVTHAFHTCPDLRVARAQTRVEDGRVFRAGYIPATKPYALSECLADLLETAARLLVLGGRMCYWMPDFIDYESAHGSAQHGAQHAAQEAGAGAASEDGSAAGADDGGEVTEVRWWMGWRG